MPGANGHAFAATSS